MKLKRTAAYAAHVAAIAQQGDARPIIGHAAAKGLGIPEG
jgi:hypothetical protein